MRVHLDILLSIRNGNGWGDVIKVRNVSFRMGRKCERPKKKECQSLTQQPVPGEGRGSAIGWRVNLELILIHWYGFIISLRPEQGAGWLAGWLALLGGGARPDGANGIPMPEPHLSVVMAGWQVLMDRWSWRLSWQSCLADELWNETDIQKLWAAQAWTDPTPPHLVLPSSGQLVWQRVPQCSYPSFTMTEVMWAAKLCTAETHCPALGLDLKSFNDRLRPSITLTFLFNAVLVEYKIK